MISEVSGAYSCQTSVHRSLHSQVAQGLEPVIKRHPAIPQFQLPDFALGHCFNVNYRLQLSTCALSVLTIDTSLPPDFRGCVTERGRENVMAGTLFAPNAR